MVDVRTIGYSVDNTAGATLKTGEGRVWGVQCSAAVGTTAEITIKDGGASGTEIWNLQVLTTTAGKGDHDFNLHGLTYKTSLYVVASNTTRFCVQYT